MIIKNGKLALPGENDFVQLDIKIERDKIALIAENIEPSSDERTLDATGLCVLPGAIDPHVHFNASGFTEHEDFYHGTSAAAAGGITTVIDMPCTSIPPVVNLENLKTKLKSSQKKR